MAVLLLRCSGPMQAWGSRSRFGERDTEREPTKSGIVGMLCAALGKPRTESPGDGFPLLSELAALRMGVRADHEGVVRRDFHTAGGGSWAGDDYGVAKSSGGKGDTVISNRYYLSDAVFLVGLEGDPALLERLHTALHRPVWTLCLGRKAFVPGEPVALKGTDGLCLKHNLESALKTFPHLEVGRVKSEPRIRFVIEWRIGDSGEPTVSRQDQPVSFELGARKHQVRRMREFLEDASILFKAENHVSDTHPTSGQ